MVKANYMEILNDKKEEITVQYVLQRLPKVFGWLLFCTMISVKIENGSILKIKQLEKLPLKREKKMKT